MGSDYCQDATDSGCWIELYVKITQKDFTTVVAP